MTSVPLWTYGCFAAAVPLLAGLWLRERRAEQAGRTPLIPPRVVRRPAFATGALFALLYFASFTSIFFALTAAGQPGLWLVVGALLLTGLGHGLIVGPRSCWPSPRRAATPRPGPRRRCNHCRSAGGLATVGRYRRARGRSDV
jgi:hypothetical protein